MVFFYLLESVPEQTGPLITPAALPTLDPQQIQQLQMAKKYCQDITNKFVSFLLLSIQPELVEYLSSIFSIWYLEPTISSFCSKSPISV